MLQFEITPKIFSPDNDGHDDVATIQYKVTGPGYVANITIYDAQGRPVRYLCQEWNIRIRMVNGIGMALMKKETNFRSVLILFTLKFFNLQAKKQQFKNTVVLARKLS